MLRRRGRRRTNLQKVREKGIIKASIFERWGFSWLAYWVLTVSVRFGSTNLLLTCTVAYICHRLQPGYECWKSHDDSIFFFFVHNHELSFLYSHVLILLLFSNRCHKSRFSILSTHEPCQQKCLLLLKLLGDYLNTYRHFIKENLVVIILDCLIFLVNRDKS